MVRFGVRCCGYLGLTDCCLFGGIVAIFDAGCFRVMFVLILLRSLLLELGCACGYWLGTGCVICELLLGVVYYVAS